MTKNFIYYILLCATILTPLVTNAQRYYAPAKVVYDVASSDATEIAHILDRVSLLQKIYQAENQG